jgi:hypothetical protein
MMKKILVVLLVLAVAAGVFAQQGEWTLGGMAELGTRLNLDPNGGEPINGESAKAVVSGEPYNGYEALRGVLNLNYNAGGLQTGLDFNAKRDGSDLSGHIQYYGDKYAFYTSTNLRDLFNGNAKDRLWGYYDFLDGMVRVKAALGSNWEEIWTSNQVAGIVATYNNGTGYVNDKGEVQAYPYPKYLNGGYDVFQGPWADTYSWGRTDGDDYLLANVNLSSLQFGIRVPALFAAGGYGLLGTPEKRYFTNGTEDNVKYNTGVFNQSVVGLKFSQQLFEFAAQFLLKDYGVYFGGKVNLGPVNAGLSFSGVLGEKNANDENVGLKMKVGGSVNYSADAFGVGAKAWLGQEKDSATNQSYSQIGIEPNFFYKVIPTHLRFVTDVGFYFNSHTADGEKDTEYKGSVIWAVRPQLFWNFLGTDAGDFGGNNTGVSIRYTVISGQRGQDYGKTNTLDVVFKWGVN